MLSRTPSDPPRESDPRPQSERPRTLMSDELLAGQKEILIDHYGETYRLRCTRHGKLILYK